jgi:spermidine/putrescine transport system substrate-binding protein
LEDDVGGSLSRRSFLERGLVLGAGAGTVALLGAGCASGSSSPAKQSDTGTINFMTYPSWVGPTEIASFEKAHPEVTVKQITGGVSSSAQQVALIAQNPNAYDLGLLDRISAGQLTAGGFLQPFDPASVPNLALVDQSYQKAYPWGIPTDYGLVGIAYREDLVTDSLSSWSKLWDAAAKYSGKIVMVDYDQMIIGLGMIHAGYKVDDGAESHLQTALKLLTTLKPHVGSIIATNTSKGLVGPNPSAVISVDFDFDVALAQESDPRIKFLIPEEGAPGYLEGWCAVKGTKHLSLVEQFMNSHLDPKMYATFLETTGAPSVVPSASHYLSAKLTAVQALNLPSADLGRVQYTGYIAAGTAAQVSSIYSQFKSS